MPEPDFNALQKELLLCGVAPRHVRRLVEELIDHLEDLVEAEVTAGNDIELARRNAFNAIGEMRDIARAISARPELHSWSYRFPRLALVVFPVACLALLPIYPLLAGASHRDRVARWGVSLLLGASVTAAMLLVLQLSIAFA